MKKYKIIILILSLVVTLEGILLVNLWNVRNISKLSKLTTPAAPVVTKGKIAIVIDDWGYNLNNLNALDEIKYPLTISILPNLAYSRRISEESHRRGFEVILHLPMEPHEKVKLEKNTITTSMNEKTIKNILEQDLNNILYAKGVSNHMGSKATENLRIMKIIFQELKNRHLYFLDSIVSKQSICFDLAHKEKVLFAKRDVFLDNRQNPEYIKERINKLKTIADTYGQAIGIGHDRKVTLTVLKETMPELERKGYKFVYVSELVK